MKRTKTTIECNVSHLTRGLFTKLLTFSPSLCVKLRHSKILLFIRLNEKKYNILVRLFKIRTKDPLDSTCVVSQKNHQRYLIDVV